MPGPSGPGYIVIKRIAGHSYRYRQWSWREGGRVRSKCRCLGRADGPAGDAPQAPTYAVDAVEAWLKTHINAQVTVDGWQYELDRLPDFSWQLVPVGGIRDADGVVDGTIVITQDGTPAWGEWSYRTAFRRLMQPRPAPANAMIDTATALAEYDRLMKIAQDLYAQSTTGEEPDRRKAYAQYLYAAQAVSTYQAHALGRDIAQWGGGTGAQLFRRDFEDALRARVPVKTTKKRRAIRDVSKTIAALPTHRARDVPLVDEPAEQRLIDRVFACNDIAGRWERPWLGGRYSGVPTWMPDKRLHLLAAKLGVVGKSSPFGELVDFGWRKKRYKIQASYSSDNVLQIPDHTRFKADPHATAEQNFAHTLLHELAHATGARKECRRPTWNRFGSAGYAREEMVADLTAHIMAHRLGLAPRSTANVSWYVDNWSRQLRDKAQARDYAKREALRAADYLTKLWGEIVSVAPSGTDD